MIVTNAFAGPILASQDRASLISRFAASGRARLEIPVPDDALVFRLGQIPPGFGSYEVLNPSLKHACSGLMRTVREGRKLIALTGSTKSTVCSVFETALQSLGYEHVYRGPIKSYATLLKILSDHSIDDREKSSGQFVIVVEDAQTLSVSSFQTLVQLAEGQVRLPVQVLLAGRSELTGKLREGGYQTFASKVVKISLEHESDTKPHSEVEFDLARAWHGAEAAKRHPEVARESTVAPVSPFPALAALLNQTAPSRSIRRRTAIISTLIVLLGLAFCGGLVGLTGSARDKFSSWTHYLRAH